MRTTPPRSQAVLSRRGRSRDVFRDIWRRFGTTAIAPITAPAGAPGASIRIFLIDGTPDGLRLVEKSNWTGLGIVAPRSQYSQARQCEEFARPEVYVLVGPGSSALPQIYVGEAEELRSRLDNHQQSKDFWTRVVAFISKDGNINKPHARCLESRLVGLATAAKRAELMNGTAPALPALSEPDAADMENFPPRDAADLPSA